MHLRTTYDGLGTTEIGGGAVASLGWDRGGPPLVTPERKKFCGQISKKLWTNEVGEVKNVG